MANNTVRHINIIGHQNPDTDSICSALAYAWLKNRGSLTGLYEARRAGHVNRETRFVLQHFGVEAPRLCTDVSPAPSHFRSCRMLCTYSSPSRAGLVSSKRRLNKPP